MLSSFEKLLKLYERGEISRKDFLKRLKWYPFIDLGEVKLDTQRRLRKGVPEIVYGKGKSYNQLLKIIEKVFALKIYPLIITKLNNALFSKLKEKFPMLEYNEDAQILYYKGKNSSKRKIGEIAVLSAGTSDFSIAEEAALTAELLGLKVRRFYDIGVAGIHRTFEIIPKLKKAKCIIVIAGMDGVLPSVIAGLVKKPLIAVPTSVGYGASFRGISALLTMLNSCSPGVGVVNIDNGFGAGYLAYLIAR